MVNGTKTNLSWKDGLYIIGFIIMILGFLNSRGNIVAEQALQKDQVKRNTQILEEHDLHLIDYRLAEIDKKLIEIKDLIKDMYE